MLPDMRQKLPAFLKLGCLFLQLPSSNSSCPFFWLLEPLHSRELRWLRGSASWSSLVPSLPSLSLFLGLCRAV